MTQDRAELVRDIAEAINRNSAENGSDTPDFILAEYLVGCLEAFNAATRHRAKWYDPDAPEREELGDLDAAP